MATGAGIASYLPGRVRQCRVPKRFNSVIKRKHHSVPTAAPGSSWRRLRVLWRRNERAEMVQPAAPNADTPPAVNSVTFQLDRREGRYLLIAFIALESPSTVCRLILHLPTQSSDQVEHGGVGVARRKNLKSGWTTDPRGPVESSVGRHQEARSCSDCFTTRLL